MKTKLKKCIYILHLLRTHREISRREINEKLCEEFMDDPELSRATFARYIEFIEENFPCRVEYDAVHNTYTLYNQTATYKEDTQLFDYLYNMYSAEVSLPLLLKHHDKIHNAEVISGTDKLDIILRAIDEHRGYTCDYTSFNNGTVKRRTFIPLFLSAWEGRWYVVAHVTTHPDGVPYTYALERMDNIELTEERIVHYSKVTADEYFKDSYGIQHHSPDDEPQDILICATGSQVQYLQSRPIHPSQEMLTDEEASMYLDVSNTLPSGFLPLENEGNEGSKESVASRERVFRLHLTPCYNFYQQLLWHREGIEVLSPQSVKDELKQIILKLSELYT